jgi:PEP-CTERM motif
MAVAVAIVVLAIGFGSASAIPLGPFSFSDNRFGNTLLESDGGTFRSQNWLNLLNVDPSNPGALTGANFNTGIANIGISGPSPLYTIGYNTPIPNVPGNDLGIVAGFSVFGDTFSVSASTDGVTFGRAVGFSGSAAVSTGVSADYFYGGNTELNETALFVIPIDLSLLGIADGASVSAISITGSPEADIFRVAGFAPVPEPSTLLLLATTAAGLGLVRRRLRKDV